MRYLGAQDIELRWTDMGGRIMAAILFLITYQNIPKWFQIYKICAFNKFPAYSGRISARGDEIFKNLNEGLFIITDVNSKLNSKFFNFIFSN